jgi:hypothetical protein
MAMKFHWYSLLWWFDMPMHYLGGVWLGLAIMYFFPPKESSEISVIKVIIGVLAFAVAWEIFEYIVDENISRNGFDLLDTMSDICFGLAGGFTATLYFFKRIAQQAKSSYNLTDEQRS